MESVNETIASTMAPNISTPTDIPAAVHHMIESTTTAEPLVTEAIDHWTSHMTVFQTCFIALLPVVSLIAIYVYLRCIWIIKEPRHTAPPISYGTVPTTTEDDSVSSPNVERKASYMEEGEVAGDYAMDWKKTFDFVFLIGMVAFLVLLLILTVIFEPALLKSAEFWVMQLPKLATMLAVSTLGGLICRRFCDVDDKGYILTNKSSKFKVNYTRKLQHFAAYMVPLVIKSDFHGPLALAWGDFFTMCGFLVLIKPVREAIPFFMLQFNALDRPEDRPHTLKWIIAANIAPGLVILLFFKWLLGDYDALTFIIVFITGIGDGLAEPVGITWGKHKYKSRGCFSTRTYTRSYEGSACVFMSAMIFPAMQYADFSNFTQVVLAMLILPPTMAYGEAIAPHTADTPVLMIGCGTILYLIVHYV